MAQGNRSFVQGLAEDASPAAPLAKLPPRTSVLQNRENRLSQLANGQSVNRVHELVDPARCRIWEAHNRDYGALDETACADLIESFKAQGRQEVPAIVRRLRSDTAFDFEVICGARRHWTVNWMRQHGYPTFGFLVEPRELDDEEAFRVADLENRSRKDLSDLERARDYARAVERFYSGNQQRMAERLQVTKSWLSRYLELARLPEPVIAAFEPRQAIGISHGAQLAPLLRDARARESIVTEAVAVAAEQGIRKGEGKDPIAPAAVVQRLIRTARSNRERRATQVTEHTVRADDGVVVARGNRMGRSSVTITVPHAARFDQAALLAACQEILGRLASTALTDAKGTRRRGRQD
jgi:ParB family chromosome partitioning protein